MCLFSDTEDQAVHPQSYAKKLGQKQSFSKLRSPMELWVTGDWDIQCILSSVGSHGKETSMRLPVSTWIMARRWLQVSWTRENTCDSGSVGKRNFNDLRLSFLSFLSSLSSMENGDREKDELVSRDVIKLRCFLLLDSIVI